MKTVKPVSKETYAKIGAGYLICAEHPEIFGDVTFRKFCDMFVDDIIDEGEDEHKARIKAAAPEMYRMLQRMRDLSEYTSLAAVDQRWATLVKDVNNLLSLIDDYDDEECAGDE